MRLALGVQITDSGLTYSVQDETVILLSVKVSFRIAH